MASLKGNCIVAQSGGPTAVINASACGVIQTALQHPDVFTGVIGANNGILGVLNEDLFDLAKEDPAAIEGLKAAPAAAIGSCRYKLKDFDRDRGDYERILEVFAAHNIRCFFYCGGNDSMDTADKVARLARDKKYDLVAIGVPKTVDNDLAETDHCPGYGSIVKYLAASVLEAGRDTESLYTTDTVTIVEVMGRNAGWIAAGTGVAQRSEKDAPHLIYLPEIPFVVERFVEDVREVIRRLGGCVVVVGEGVRNETGQYLAEAGGAFGKDSFGHTQLGGAGEVLRAIVEKEVKVKARTNKLGTHQRAAMHFASLTDRDEAYACGQAAVRAALAGENAKMVTLVRSGTGPDDYRCTTGLTELAKVANGEKKVPRSFLNERGNHITQAMRDYVTPLLRGEVPIQIGPDGLPVYVRLAKHALARRTPPRDKAGG